MIVNINASVRVRLNERGRRQWAAHHALLGIPSRYWRVPEDGVLGVPLWEIMHVFGPVLVMGSEAPFEGNNIEFLEAVEGDELATLRSRIAALEDQLDDARLQATEDATYDV